MPTEERHLDLVEAQLVEAHRLLKRRFRRRAMVGLSLLALLVIVAFLSDLAVGNRKAATEAADRAENLAMTLKRSLPTAPAIIDGNEPISISKQGWLVRGGTPFRQVTEGPIQIAILSPNQDLFAIVGPDGVFVGPTDQSNHTSRLPADTPVTALSFSADDGRLAIASANGVVSLWAGTTLLTKFRSPLNKATAVAFNSDLVLCALGESSGEVMLWNTQTDERVDLPWHHVLSPVQNIAFSTNGHALLIQFQNGRAVTQNIESGLITGEFGDPGPTALRP